MATKTSKATISADVKKLLDGYSSFQQHMLAGDMEAAKRDLETRNEIAKRDRAAFDLAVKQAEAQTDAADAPFVDDEDASEAA